MTETFKRYEKKYLLSPEKFNILIEGMAPYLTADAYSTYTVCNLYYDTPDYRLIRMSLEKPVYKEKLRLRSYGIPGAKDSVFLELKKKYKGIVYKRRIALTLEAFRRGEFPEEPIPQEIAWFMQMYHNPMPVVYLAYDREAFSGSQDIGLRVTFDRNIRWRDQLLDLSKGCWGTPLLGNEVLMEVKIPSAMPLWMCRLLSQYEIYPVSFSKYGTCYRNCLSQQRKEIVTCA